MKRKRIFIILTIIVLLSLIIRPVRHFWTGFFSGLFAKEVVLYDGFPVSNDTIYRAIHNGEFECDQYLIELSDSNQIMFDKQTKKTSKNRIKWVNENEYYLYYSNSKAVLKNKVINLTDTSFTIIYSIGKPARKIDLKIKTAHNRVYNQLLYVPVRAGGVSFSTNKVGPGQLIKPSVSRYISAQVHAIDHTRGRKQQFYEIHSRIIWTNNQEDL